MKQTCAILSTYTADVSGVASALYEMGGMTVIHDASGCNSTYNTHDEPRWYDIPSMVYISALCEMDALLGDDEKIIGDITRTAEELNPRFIAIAGTPIPMMMGTDFKGLAHLIENRTKIPTFGFATNGMNSYDKGAGAALAAIADRFCPDKDKVSKVKNDALRVNLLGVTPLDFSVTGNVEAMKASFEEAGFAVNSCWAMGSSWEELMSAGAADVNVAASSCGLPLAKLLKEKYGTPYITGLPVGEKASDKFFSILKDVYATGKDASVEAEQQENAEIIVIGEQVQSTAIAAALNVDFGVKSVKVISPLDFPDEDMIFSSLKNAKAVIADPLYIPAVPKGCKFISMPHEGYSGRIFRDDIPVIMKGDFNKWISVKISL